MERRMPARLRGSAQLRDMVRENRIDMSDIICPVFFVEGKGIKEEIPSLRGQYHYSVDAFLKDLPELKSKGIRALLLFGVPKEKDAQADCAKDAGGVVQSALRALKEADGGMLLLTDVCLCQYKSDGHCCFFHGDGHIDREKTLKVLVEAALSHAQAGADILAPSDMMDGRVGAIREALDEGGYSHVPIMAYSAKYASSFYGPFRDAAHSAPGFGDRKAYQMDPANKREALVELLLDVEEGADFLMVKPAMPYLDIIQDARQNTRLPVAAYQVSGEYALLRNGFEQGILEEKGLFESLLCIKRSGADLIITYFAKDVQEWIGRYQTEGNCV
ncbi:porphobilinogen synthase [Anaerotalea alkaliphila]